MIKKSLNFAALILALVILCTSCGIEKPEQAVTNALNAVKNLDRTTAQKYFSFNEMFNSNSRADELLKDDENLKLLFNKLNFKIISSSKEGDTATVKTEITNIDMSVILGEFFKRQWH